MEHLSLYELNNLVRSVLETTLEETYWVVAELSEVRVAQKGHCYLEFVEKDEHNHTLLAKASGVIWRNTYVMLCPTFEQATGCALQVGMKVLVQVGVSFHELYGYSLVVHNIDPSYTLGEVARLRKKILAQLEEDGVLTMNKELELPRPLLRIAVISSQTAAGYGDFCRQLEQSGYAFRTSLFPAIMQGDKVEESVIAALDKIAEEKGKWEAVVIIRGGGAVSDLQGFESYLLAANVAQFPLPVITGIGHERDETVLDHVAHTRCKTPTAVAAFLVELRKAEHDGLEELARNLQEAVRMHLVSARMNLGRTAAALATSSLRCLKERHIQISRQAATLEISLPHRLQTERDSLLHIAEHLGEATDKYLESHRRLLQQTAHYVETASPERLMKMGFCMARKNGKIITDISRIKQGDHITLSLIGGTASATVDDVLPEK